MDTWTPDPLPVLGRQKMAGILAGRVLPPYQGSLCIYPSAPLHRCPARRPCSLTHVEDVGIQAVPQTLQTGPQVLGQGSHPGSTEQQAAGRQTRCGGQPPTEGRQRLLAGPLATRAHCIPGWMGLFPSSHLEEKGCQFGAVCASAGQGSTSAPFSLTKVRYKS